MNVLVIEDDDETASLMRLGLESVGHSVTRASDGREGLILASTGSFDVAVVDRMMPGFDGVAVVTALRRIKVETPVLFLTALGGVADRVGGLECGGDDYLVKPFYPEELNARLQALARRAAKRGADQSVVSFGDLIMNRTAHSVVRGEMRMELLPLEYKLLEQLILAQGQAVTRSMLIREVWGLSFDPGTNIVENHISKLRAKIDQGPGGSIIATIRGVGYALSCA